MTELLNATDTEVSCQEEFSQDSPSIHQHYNHEAAVGEIDKMNKELESLKESLIRSSVRCHILEVDLATQFSPDMQCCLRNTQQNCEKCKETLADLLENDESEDVKETDVIQPVLQGGSPENVTSEHNIDAIMD